MAQPSQPCCSPSLLDLPVEIRLQIYDHLIKSFSWGSAIHVFLTSQRNPLYPPSLGSGQLTYTPCLCPTQSPSLLHSIALLPDLPGYCAHYKSCRGLHLRNGKPPALQGTYLSLFVTCKTIHSEAIHFLYTNLAFHISSIPTVHAFLTQCPLPSLSHLTTLNLTLHVPATYLYPPPAISYTSPTPISKPQWITTTCLLSCLPSLTHLTITIWNETYHRFLETEMLLPLREIRVQPGGSFVVYVPYQDDGADPNPLPTTTTVSQDSGRNSKKRVKMRIERRPQGPHDPASLQPAYRDVQPSYPVQRLGRARRMIIVIKRVLERPFSLGGH